MMGFPGGSDGKEPVCDIGDLGLILGSARSPREGNGYPIQYSSWWIPWTEEPDRLQSMRSQRVGQESMTKHNKILCPSQNSSELDE